MNNRIALNLGLVLLLLLACGKTEKRPAVSGTISVCNNLNCGIILGGNLQVTFIKYPVDSKFSSTLDDILADYERPQYELTNWIDSVIYDNQEGPIVHQYSAGWIFINGELLIDSSKLCGECSKFYEKHNLALNTSREMVNLVQAGFRTQLQVKDALARNFGYYSYADIDELTNTGKSVKYACEDACEALVTRGFSFERAVVWAQNSYKSMFDTYTGASKLREKAPKDPDEMTDAEWYDYMESLSDDPVWKETVRKQREAKGIR